MLKALMLVTLWFASHARLAAQLDAIALRIDEHQQTEHAAFLVRGLEGELELVHWPATGQFRSATYAGVLPERTIATIHTHPHHAERPSTHDIAEARRLRLPFLVITRRTISVVDPRSGRISIAPRRDLFLIVPQLVEAASTFEERCEADGWEKKLEPLTGLEPVTC